jgi:hypothetical protein
MEANNEALEKAAWVGMFLLVLIVSLFEKPSDND